jgi:hypothetical protein
MYRFRAFLIRLMNIFRRSRLEADLQEQLEAHRGMVEADLVSRGMNASSRCERLLEQDVELSVSVWHWAREHRKSCEWCCTKACDSCCWAPCSD